MEGESAVIVGYALENYSGQADGKILAFVDLDSWAVSGQVSGSLNESLLSQIASAAKSWLEEMKIFIENGLLRVREIIVEKLTATLVDTLTVKTKNIELIDSVSGETYCVGIANGEWQKTLGECATDTASTTTTTSEQPELNGPSQAPPPPPGLGSQPAASTTPEQTATSTSIE